MKKYILKIIALIVSVSIPVCMFLGYIFTIPDGMSGTIAATLRYKIPLLENTPSPKIIMVGGSSSPYGVNCSQIATEMSQDCICIGATAYLGKGIYLNILEKYAKPGDTIVIGFENTLLEDEVIDYDLVWQGAGNDTTVWKNVPISYYPGLFSTAIGYSVERKNYSVNGWTNDIHPSFGPLGDITEERDAILESGYNKQDIRYLNRDTISLKELDKINKFAKKMENKGVSVYFVYAPLDIMCVDSTSEEIAEYSQIIADNLDIPMIVSIDDALMDGEYFFNTNNHLTTLGAQIYSEKIVAGLKNQ